MQRPWITGLGRVAIALLAWSVPCPAAQAQGSPVGSDPAVETYRLTMPTLRKVLPALSQPQVRGCEKGKNETLDPATMPLADITARLERCAPMRDAIAKSGVSTREAALTLAALARASKRFTEEESAKAVGGQAPPLPPGVLKDNLTLIRENETELGRLTRPGEGGGTR